MKRKNQNRLGLQTLALISCIVPLTSCKKKAEAVAAPEAPQVASIADKELAAQDTPILPVEKGDSWTYQVRLEVPAGLTSPTAKAVDQTSEMKRSALGKMKIPEKNAMVDVFEVTRPLMPAEQELLEISDTQVLLRGTKMPSAPNGGLQWLENPVVFMRAGVRPGQQTGLFKTQDGERERDIQVIAREGVTVPAGDFNTIRILMTGSDGNFKLRKTTWFTPGIGIVKEEKTRYIEEKLLFRETTELTSTSLKLKK